MTSAPSIEAVAELIRTQKLRIEITPTIGYWVKAPCLLTQLHEAITLGAETGGRGIPTSRAPINPDAYDLWHEIVYDTHAWAHHLGLPRKDTHPDLPTPHVGRLLRSCAAIAISTGQQPIADRIEHNAHKWASQITTLLTGHTEQRGIRGATCPDCDANSILEDRPGDGIYRIPAIVLVTRDTLHWLVCRACGWTDPINLDPQLVHAVGSLDSPSTADI